MHATVREIHISVEGEPPQTYFLRVDWKTEMLDPSRCSFRVLLTDGQNAWRGKVSEAMLRTEAEELEVEKERYIQDLQEALTGTEVSTQYSFTLSPPPPPPGGQYASKMTLFYEKVQKGISLRLGSVTLRVDPAPAEAVKDLLLLSVERERTLKTQNQELQEHNHRLTTEYQHVTAELKGYVDGKESLETELYSRFLLVLNEKKRKMRQLKETIKQLEEARSEAAEQSTSASPQQKEKEEDEYGGSTDEEQPGPNTSTSTSQGARSNSPLMSLSDITDVAPSRKRRIHHPRPTDPTETKRPSAETERETGRKQSSVSNRRGSSQAGSSTAAASQQKAPQQPHPLPATIPIEADDLFDDF